MCLIIYRPAGIEVESELLINGISSNSDGYGIMYAENGKIHTVKSMDMKNFFEDYYNLDSNLELLIHFRYATHGTKDLNNCHPFRITDDFYLMHNGILDIYEDDETLSDTGHFVRDYLAPILEIVPDMIDSPAFQTLISDRIGTGNKFVILRNDGTIYFFNASEGEEYKGLWLSNGYSIPKKEKAKAAHAGSFIKDYSQYNYKWDDDFPVDWDDEYKKLERKAIQAESSITDDWDIRDVKFDVRKLTIDDLVDFDKEIIIELLYHYPSEIADIILKW